MKRQNQRRQQTTRKKRQSNRRNAIPRNEREAEARERALATLALMRREKLSLGKAAKAEGTNPRTVRRYVGSALRQEVRGERYRPTAYDRIPRTLHVLTSEGMQTVKVRGSRQASLVAEHWVAAHRYLETGDKSVRRKFRGRSFVDASGKKVRLMTDLKELDRQGHAGELRFESIYPK